MNRAARRRAATGPGRTAQGDEDRLRLLHSNTRQIDERYRDARRHGEADPIVVLVVDLCDPEGRELAKLAPRWGTDGSADLERIPADCAAHGENPTACLSLCRPVAVQMLSHFAPGAARQIQTKAPPPGYCWVCVVAKGGTLTAQYRGGASGGTVTSFAH